MGHPFRHPEVGELLKRVANLFKSDNCFIKNNSNVVFVCGGSVDGDTMRAKFCRYANKNISNVRIFLAETAQKDYVLHDDPEFHNVAEFEEIIAELSKCVVIFPESPGSFAELGYFSRNDDLRKKLLIVNNSDLQGQDSFLSLGPIGLIDSNSNFRPTIQIDYVDTPNFELVKERLEKRIPAHNRRRFSAKIYSKLTTEEKFFSIFEMIRIFGALKFDQIVYVFRSVWKHASRSHLQQLVSILVAAKYLHRGGEENDFFVPDLYVSPFLEFGDGDATTLRMQARDFYVDNFTEAHDLLVERAR